MSAFDNLAYEATHEGHNPDAITPHLAKIAIAKGFEWLSTGKLRQDEYTRGALHRWLREEHHLDICWFPVYRADKSKFYRIYIRGIGDAVPWNPLQDQKRPENQWPTLEIALEHAFEAALNLIDVQPTNI